MSQDIEDILNPHRVRVPLLPAAGPTAARSKRSLRSPGSPGWAIAGTTLGPGAKDLRQGLASSPLTHGYRMRWGSYGELPCDAGFAVARARQAPLRPKS